MVVLQQAGKSRWADCYQGFSTLLVLSNVGRLWLGRCLTKALSLYTCAYGSLCLHAYVMDNKEAMSIVLQQLAEEKPSAAPRLLTASLERE